MIKSYLAFVPKRYQRIRLSCALLPLLTVFLGGGTQLIQFSLFIFLLCALIQDAVLFPGIYSSSGMKNDFLCLSPNGKRFLQNVLHGDAVFALIHAAITGALFLRGHAASDAIMLSAVIFVSGETGKFLSRRFSPLSGSLKPLLDFGKPFLLYLFWYPAFDMGKTLRVITLIACLCATGGFFTATKYLTHLTPLSKGDAYAKYYR